MSYLCAKNQHGSSITSGDLVDKRIMQCDWLKISQIYRNHIKPSLLIYTVPILFSRLFPIQINSTGSLAVSCGDYHKVRHAWANQIKMI